MEFIDTHCHLDDDAFREDRQAVIAEAEAVGVRHFIDIGFEPSRWSRAIQLAEHFPQISFTLGLHPNSANVWSIDVADQLAELVGLRRPVAIGEIGLDLYRDRSAIEQQRPAFRDQLELARQFSLPVVIHMRGDVEAEVMDTLRTFPDVPAVFHSFDGSPRLRDFAIDRGDLIGVGGLMTKQHASALRETLRSVPIEMFLLETDAPYLAPRGWKNRRNTPSAIPRIAQELSVLLQVSLETVASVTTANAKRLLANSKSSIIGRP